MKSPDFFDILAELLLYPGGSTLGFSASGPGYKASCSSWGLAATLSLAMASQLSLGSCCTCLP